MSKEPGELAYEAWVKAYGGTTIPWDKLGDDERDEWASVESAIRADESAKAYLAGHDAGVEKMAEYFESPEAAAKIGERIKERMLPLLDAARAATIEECAKVADDSDPDFGRYEIAEAIRSLGSKP
jgi:hypothetical protein